MLSIIVAVAKDNIIGGDNKLLWHISEDLKRFRDITTNHTIIMGRKTFDSLPKILPNRHHVVITRDKDYFVDSDQVTILHNLEEVVEKFKDSEEEAFIIGGGEIYSLLYPHCQKLYLTKVYKSFKGDTYFPNIDLSDWHTVYKSDKKVNASDNLEFEFIDLIKNR